MKHPFATGNHGHLSLENHRKTQGKSENLRKTKGKPQETGALMGLSWFDMVKVIGILLENCGLMGFDGTIIAFENCPFIFGLMWFYRDYNGIMGE